MQEQDLDLRPKQYYAPMWVNRNGYVGIGMKGAYNEAMSELASRSNLGDKKQYVIREVKEYIEVTKE